jgi:hypothetical protein
MGGNYEHVDDVTTGSIYKVAVYADQALLLGVHPDLARHRGGPFPHGKEAGRQDWA